MDGIPLKGLLWMEDFKDPMHRRPKNVSHGKKAPKKSDKGSPKKFILA